MSYNGSGTFNINSTGQPVVAGTVITASAFNALTTDLATGLTTAITKDGQTTTTARITFAQGITSSLVTDSSSVSTGSIITAGGAGIAKNLYVGVNANVAGTLGVTGVATFSAAPIYSSLTASSAVATDASKGLVSVTNTGTGNNVLATSPTITTPTISSLSSASATALTLQSAGTTAITVSTSQNVGIGVTAPAKPLSVYGGDGYIQMLNASTGTATGDGAFIGVEGGTTALRIVNQENDVISFSTNGLANERMRIDSSGNVMVATTSSAGKLNVAGQVTATGGIFTANGAPALSAAAAGEAMLAPDSGSGAILYGRGTTYDVAICQRSTAVALGVVTGTVNLVAPGVYSQTNPNAANVFVGSGGDLYRSTSSLKYKKNIENSVHGLTDLLNLRSVTYQSNNSDNGEQVFGGFIAEEVHDAGLTEFVQYAEDGSPDALAYGNMVALCVKAIQELKAINDSLTARIVALESK